MRSKLLTSTAALVLLLSTAPAWAQSAEGIATFLDTEIDGLSVLSRADQEAEMQWFQDAAKPFAGMEIKVVSETITAHTGRTPQLRPWAFATDGGHTCGVHGIPTIGFSPG